MIEVPSASWHTLSAALPKEQACAIVPAHVPATGVGVDPTLRALARRRRY